MSRIGKKPIPIPDKVDVVVDGSVVRVKSGDKSLEMNLRPEATVTVESDPRQVVVAIRNEKDRQQRAYWGMTRALINNMIEGVTKGFSRTLEITGVGWGAVVSGQKLDLKLGYANVISMPIPTGIQVSVEKNVVKIQGHDKQAVGQFAAAVRSKRKPEPYNAKGIKYDFETVRRKQGKVFGS